MLAEISTPYQPIDQRFCLVTPNRLFRRNISIAAKSNLKLSPAIRLQSCPELILQCCSNRHRPIYVNGHSSYGGRYGIPVLAKNSSVHSHLNGQREQVGLARLFINKIMYAKNHSHRLLSRIFNLYYEWLTSGKEFPLATRSPK